MCTHTHVLNKNLWEEERQPGGEGGKLKKTVFLTLYERVFILFQTFYRVASDGEPSVSFHPISPSSGAEVRRG